MRRGLYLAAGVALLALAAWGLRSAGPRWETRLSASEVGYKAHALAGGLLTVLRLSADAVTDPESQPDRQGALTVIDAETGQVLRVMCDKASAFTNLLISPDGSRAAGIVEEPNGKQTLHLADLRTGRTIEVPVPGERVASAAFSPGGEGLFLRAVFDDPSQIILIIDPETGATLDRIACSRLTRECCFRGRWALIDEDTEPIRIAVWDCVRRLRLPPIGGASVADGRGLPECQGGGHLVGEARGGVRVLETAGATGPRLIGKEVNWEGWLLGCNDTQMIRCEGTHALIRAYDRLEGRKRWEQPLLAATGDIQRCRHIVSRRWLLVSGELEADADVPSRPVEMFDLGAGRRAWSSPSLWPLVEEFGLGGRWLAAADRNGRRVRLLDPATGEGQGVELPAQVWDGSPGGTRARFVGGRLWFGTCAFASPPPGWQSWLPEWMRSPPADRSRIYALDPGSNHPAFSTPWEFGRVFFPLEDGSGVITIHSTPDNGAVLRRYDINTRPAWRAGADVLAGLVGLVLLAAAVWAPRQKAPEISPGPNA